MKLISTESLNNWVGNWLAKHKYYHPHSRCNSIPISELKDILNLMPEVEAEPVRHGRWIKHDDGRVRPFWEMYECSQCGTRADSSNYCPNCGAKMDSERKEE